MKELVIKLRSKYGAAQVEAYATKRGWQDVEGGDTAAEFVEKAFQGDLDKAFVSSEARKAGIEAQQKAADDLKAEFSK
jgi:hypothetical protein